MNNCFLKKEKKNKKCSYQIKKNLTPEKIGH